VYQNVGFYKQLMDEELKLFGSSSPIPVNYEKAFAIFRGEIEISPSKIFKQFMVAAAQDDISYAEKQKRTLDEWPNMWPASTSIQDIFMCSIENVRSDARALAVEFICELRSREHFTFAEVSEGFALLQGLDLDDMRIDVPLIDDYIAQILQEAETRGLPCRV